MSSNTQVIVGLVISIIVLIWLLMKTKVHVFLAMLIAALLTGLLGGMDFDFIIEMIETGFGSTLGSLGILISFGVMMGKILEKSGAAEQMGRTFVRWLGDGKEEVAVGLTGFVTSLSIFCVPGFVILMPLLKTISRRKKISIISLGVAAAGGLLLSHSLVPPASGPIGVAGIFGVNLAEMMFWGIVISIPMFIVLILISKYLEKRYYKIPDENLEDWIEDPNEEITEVSDTEPHDLPGIGASVAPIIVPVLLIFIGTLLSSYAGENIILDILIMLGEPIVALGVSVLVAIFLLSRNMTRDETLSAMDEGIASGAKIILIVGAGGALGQVVNASGVGDAIANWIAGTNIPPILLPLIISTLLRAIQGSGNVAQMTAASITAPIMATLGVSPVFAAIAVNVGSIFFSYFNDAYFWTINESMDVTDVKDQLKIWSIPSTILWLVGTITLLLLNGVFG
jgi:GntP family gluconate:H+ symporter